MKPDNSYFFILLNTYRTLAKLGMSWIKITVIFAMIMGSLADPVYLEHEHHEVEHHAHPKYEFKYGVKDTHTHDIKEQEEKRDGDRVEGYYKLLEADGTTRTVHYTADKHSGFNAHVDRSGHATHPVVEKKIELPSYSHEFEHGHF